MANYSLISVWRIPASRQVVWDALVHTEDWPVWWPHVRSVEELQPGDPSGIGNVRRYCWSTCLPYRLILDLQVIRLEAQRLIETRVSGDLVGHGRCLLSRQDAVTNVQYEWNVRTCRPWMNWLAPVAYPVFVWNHAQVMRNGERRLIVRLARQTQSRP